MRRAAGWLLAATLLAGGCALPSPQARGDHALQQAPAAGWQPARLTAGRFELLALHAAPAEAEVPELAVFIEGDGLAWLDPRTPSDDPTPRDPLALRLALAEPHRPSAWLARPCQYASASAAARCRQSDWTAARFSEEIIASMNAALDQLKQRLGARQLVLVGYSGGGAVAALLAARRDDVAQLVTVAAVLDTGAWTRAHGLSPLAGSLDPMRVAPGLAALPQWHFVGTRDAVTGRAAVQPFVDRQPGRHAHIEALPFTHADSRWAADWPRLSPR